MPAPIQLAEVLQIPLDAYNRMLRLLDAVLGPVVAPMINWASTQFGWALVLDPVWKPLFALGVMFALGIARSEWLEENRTAAIFSGLSFGFGALIGALVAAAIPADAGWWSQGARAGITIAAPVAIFLVSYMTFDWLDRYNFQVISAYELIGLLIIMLLCVLLASVIAGFSAALGFALAVSLACAAPELSPISGVLTVGFVIAFVGASFLAGGPLLPGTRRWRRRTHLGMRRGLIILGGFVAAAIILIADIGLKAIGVA